MATLFLKCIQKYQPIKLKDDDGAPFLPAQFTNDFIVKVDAHSNSPIFTEDQRNLAFSLFQAGAIDRESLIELVDPPSKQLLKERLKKMEEQQAQMAQLQMAQQTPPQQEPPQQEAA
jgi:hypothetical protein